MESMVANKPLMYSLLVSASAVLALASGLLPDIMTQFQLVEFDVEVCITYTHTYAGIVRATTRLEWSQQNSHIHTNAS